MRQNAWAAKVLPWSPQRSPDHVTGFSGREAATPAPNEETRRSAIARPCCRRNIHLCFYVHAYVRCGANSICHYSLHIATNQSTALITLAARRRAGPGTAGPGAVRRTFSPGAESVNANDIFSPNCKVGH